MVVCVWECDWAQFEWWVPTEREREGEKIEANDTFAADACANKETNEMWREKETHAKGSINRTRRRERKTTTSIIRKISLSLSYSLAHSFRAACDDLLIFFLFGSSLIEDEEREKEKESKRVSDLVRVTAKQYSHQLQ